MAAVWWRCRPIAVAAAVVALAGAGTTIAVVATPTAVLASEAGPATDGRALVRRIWLNDARWEVRSAARSALISDLPNAITAFLPPGRGYTSARDRAAKNAARNDLIISRAIATSTPVTSPFVNETAQRAQNGTLDEKDSYVRTGLAQAQALDAKHAPVTLAKKQAELDRRYVTAQAANASGAWVKAAAQRAMLRGTDNDIAEFFKYSWASAADCDLQQFRMELTEQEILYRNRLDELVAAAGTAQRAYEEASAASQQKAAAEAAAEARAAWNTAADVAASTQVTWQANQNLAASQAGSWQAVRDFAVHATTEQDWRGIATRAVTTGTAWADELAWAQEQARIWTGLETSARASATAIPVIPSTPATSGG